MPASRAALGAWTRLDVPTLAVARETWVLTMAPPFNGGTIGYYPLPPWAGLAVLCAWAATALLAGGLLLRLRDA
jgi:hypothetical protein